MADDFERTLSSIGHWTYRTSHGMSTSLNRKFHNAGYSITIEQWKALVYLWAQDGLTQLELGESMGKEQSATTRIVNNLEKNNFVVRVPNPDDRRSKRIYLTHQGRRLEAVLSNLACENVADLTRGITDEELAACIHTLAQICRNIDQK